MGAEIVVYVSYVDCCLRRRRLLARGNVSGVFFFSFLEKREGERRMGVGAEMGKGGTVALLDGGDRGIEYGIIAVFGAG